jgi:hypothetical protein
LFTVCFLRPFAFIRFFTPLFAGLLSGPDEPLTMSTPSSTAPSDLTTGPGGFEAADHARRFGGIARLYGAPALAAFVPAWR